MKKIVFNLLAFLLICSPVNSQNLTGKDGEAILTRNNSFSKAGIGTTIFQGDRITTSGDSYIYTMDFSAGTFSQRANTTVDVMVLSRTKGCSITQLLYSGKGISWQKKPFTCPLSKLIIFNRKGGVYISPRSRIELTEKDDSIIAISEYGGLIQEKNGITQTLKTGEFNVTMKNGNPGERQKIDYFLTIKNWKTRYIANAVYVSFFTSPINTVKINGKTFDVSSDGKVSALIKYPILESSLYIELDSPFTSKIIVKQIDRSKIYR
ncbi:MAG: hypothetical protein ACRC80_08530 [Waterburya sp.]